MAAFRARRRRCSRLNHSDAGMPKLSRSGVSSDVSWGMNAVGVANALLMCWRRTIAKALAADGCSKNPDLVLVVADRQEGDTTDPAFAAHALPLCDWASAIWEQMEAPRWLALSLFAGKAAPCQCQACMVKRHGPCYSCLGVAQTHWVEDARFRLFPQQSWRLVRPHQHIPGSFPRCCARFGAPLAASWDS